MAIRQKPRTGERQQDQVRQKLARVRSDEAKRLNVPVAPDLYKAMKRQAVEEDRTIAEITRQLWLDYLASRGDSAS